MIHVYVCIKRERDREGEREMNRNIHRCMQPYVYTYKQNGVHNRKRRVHVKERDLDGAALCLISRV